MFHFAIGRHHEISVAGLPIVEDRAFADRVYAAWLNDTQQRLAPDMYPLSGCVVLRWDGQTPRDFDTCMRVVEDVCKLAPDYVWIDGEVRSYRVGAVWDFSN